jgi:p-cumate 2,3-dioxygenase subunit beta
MPPVTRQQVEDFLYAEAALLDAWKLDEWLTLLTDDAIYRVPSNDRPLSDPKDTLFTIADDIHRIRARVTRLKNTSAHAEFPRSHTRRMITNVRILEQDAQTIRVAANFIVYRFRRNESVYQFVGQYRYALRIVGDSFRIVSREAIIDAIELGSLASVSFIL